MSFAAGLGESLQIRKNRARAEFTNGDGLEQVLVRHLRVVEAMAAGEIITSVLLLSSDGKQLWHGAAPGLPQSYCDAVDGSEIGPRAGSCGTAAYLGRPIYVSDISTDPLWADYRHLAIPHGLRSCWSTPIRGPDGAVMGTFAIYRTTVGEPTIEEVDAIATITEHVADAIRLARTVQDLERPVRHAPRLRIVGKYQPTVEAGSEGGSRLLSHVATLESKTAELDRIADQTECRETAEALKATVELSRELTQILRSQLDE